MDETLCAINRQRCKSLKIPAALQRISHTNVTLHSVEPRIEKGINKSWYDSSALLPDVKKAKLQDLKFFLGRQNEEEHVGWTEFNKRTSQKNISVTSIGYLPMILEPAHEFSTLNTVLQRSLYIANKTGRKYTVITVDQQLYCRLLELKWSSDDYQKRIILRMGGLHLALKFLTIIGKHMSGSGLVELWVESGIVSESSAEKVMEGKVYSKGMRLLKLTVQCLWRLITPRFYEYLQKSNSEATELLEKSNLDSLSIEQIEGMNLLHHLKAWRESEQNVELKYWMTYLEMAHILLEFTRSMREGIWDLYLHSLSEMLPYIARYDHHNYLKSLSVYIAEMHALPCEIEDEFRRGEFVIKTAPGTFNQVDADHAQEWLVGEVQDTSAGIIGIVQNPASLQRWALTYSWNACIAKKMYELFHLKRSSELRSELYPGRKRRDQNDEEALLKTMKSFGMFSFSVDGTLRNVATKDEATDAIKTSLFCARQEGMMQVEKFVSERLENQCVKYYAPVKLNNAPTFRNLYKAERSKTENVQKKNKKDRSIFQRLIAAYESGRIVHLKEILKYELHGLPLALTNIDGSLRTGNKAELSNILLENVEYTKELKPDNNSHLIVDAQAFLMSMGKPPNARTFSDFAGAVKNRIKIMSVGYQRIDFVFDR